MVQTTRDSTIAVMAVEDLQDIFTAAIADGTICDFEQEKLRRGIQVAYTATQVCDTATALQVNVGRGGLDGYRFTELANDYRRLKSNLEEAWGDPLDAA